VSDTNDPRVVHDFNAVLAEIAADDNDTGATFFRVGDREFTIPSPLEWSDEVVEIQAAAAEKKPVNPVAFAMALLGDDQYAEFKAVGGSSMKFMKFFGQIMGGDAGESPAS
jgi:hypothetical protein